MSKKKKVGFNSQIMTFSCHTNFDLYEDKTKLNEMIDELEKVEGVAKSEIKRYSIEIETGYLFNLNIVRKSALKIIKDIYGPEEVFEITSKDLQKKIIDATRHDMESNYDLESLFKQVNDLVGEA